MHQDWIYDIETYLDLFCVDFTHVPTRTRYIFEVSDRVDQSREFVTFLHDLRLRGDRLFGYNNVGFDWPICQYLAGLGSFTARDAHAKAQAIIDGDRFAHIVWPSDRMVTQGDLYLIHHFDNMARSTSLKKLEINMRSKRVVDLPYSPNEPTTSAQKDEIIAYMCHDVGETLKFYHASIELIRFRDELAEKYPDMGDVLNFNDTKIGKQFFIRELERQGTPCFERVNGRRRPRQTLRSKIALRDVISPRVVFEHPELVRVKTWLENQVLTADEVKAEMTGEHKVETKGVFKDLSATVDGFTFDFGTGGIHGSLHSTRVHEDDEWQIWDWDVASFYPNLAISNRLYPAHLSESFVDVYSQVYAMRQSYKKGTAENAMLKLALNGVYGDSNNKYSPFYDPQYTMAITINGQLMLCMFAEWLTQRSGGKVKMIQANTDGVTVKVHHTAVEWMMQVREYWENHTGLELESARYKSMLIRDVNSYIAVKTDGGIKRIGAYAYKTFHDDPYTRERQWHQNHSMLVVRKAAEANMVHGVPIMDFLTNHTNPYDFVCSIKVPRSSRLDYGGSAVQNTTRYYVSTDGAALTKFMPPLKGKIKERAIGINQGWNVTIVNDLSHFKFDNINWLYYLEETEKLIL